MSEIEKKENIMCEIEKGSIASESNERKTFRLVYAFLNNGDIERAKKELKKALNY